jgi:hypothetical protein
MANDASNLTVASNGKVSIAPVGTTLPTTPTASLNSAFNDVGYISEDGATFTKAVDIAEFFAWQSSEAVRREVNSRTYSVAFNLSEWNEHTLALAWDATVTLSGTAGAKLSLPEGGDALGEWAMVIEAQDGERTMRFVIARGNVTEDVESQFQRSELAGLPITFQALKPDTGDTVVVYSTDGAAYGVAT